MVASHYAFLLLLFGLLMLMSSARCCWSDIVWPQQRASPGSNHFGIFTAPAASLCFEWCCWPRVAIRLLLLHPPSGCLFCQMIGFDY